MSRTEGEDDNHLTPSEEGSPQSAEYSEKLEEEIRNRLSGKFTTPAAKRGSRKKNNFQIRKETHNSFLMLSAVKVGDVEGAKKCLFKGADVNFRDVHGMTALHYAAARGARPCIRLLVNSGKCDYLIKDYKGRYASELAFEWAHDYAVGLLLSKKQIKQAYEQGVPTWEKPERNK